MPLRLIAVAVLLTVALQPSFAAVCVTGCAMPMTMAASADRASQPSMAGHHHHVASSRSLSHDSSLRAVPNCGKKLEVSAPATPVPHVELGRVQPATVAPIAIEVAVTRRPERNLASSVPLQVPLRI
jgi:hypothetical protein